jgi:hypothetical protein
MSVCPSVGIQTKLASVERCLKKIILRLFTEIGRNINCGSKSDRSNRRNVSALYKDSVRIAL